MTTKKLITDKKPTPKRVIRVTIDVFDNGESGSRFSPGLNDNRASDAVFSAIERVIARLRRCQALPHDPHRSAVDS